MKQLFKENIFLVIVAIALTMFSAFDQPAVDRDRDHAQVVLYQPVAHDGTLLGTGDSSKDPLMVNHAIAYASTITQASTSAPTAYQIENLFEDTSWSYTRDSIGTYKIESDNDAEFPDSTYTFSATLGSCAADVIKFYRQSDSTLILRCENAAGIGADLVGKCYLEIKGNIPEEE